VLQLLASQSELASVSPATWTYWKQRAGNEIANDLYRDGQYLKALEIYLNLAKIDLSLSWQLPVLYQIGLVYEHLHQPQKAIEKYETILAQERELAGPLATPGLKALLDMARWRKEHLAWLDKATLASRTVKLTIPERIATNSLPVSAQ
jgi:tetratricopeptide (TPR) repeat protein